MSSPPRHADDLLRIMDLCLGDLSRDWSVSDVSKALELSMAKTSRTLNAIAEHGYLEKSVGSTYRVGMKLIVIGRAHQRVMDRKQQQIETESFAQSQGYEL